uniref:Uncharacterized protein n=1 Tax=Arundo donax TaxID=35708 RepID=A0A0A9E5D8_ARUDO
MKLMLLFSAGDDPPTRCFVGYDGPPTPDIFSWVRAPGC